MPRFPVLPVLAMTGVLVSVAMVVLGLPEANGMQTVLLELSSLPLSFSVAVGIVLLHRRADRPAGPRSRAVFRGGLVLVGVGLTVMLAAYLVGPRGLVHTGQLLVWLGLLAALLMTIRRLPRQQRAAYSVLDPDDSDGEAGEPADQEQAPSL